MNAIETITTTTPPRQCNNSFQNIITSALSPTPHETYHERQRLALTSLLSALTTKTTTTTIETYDETIIKRNDNNDNNTNDCLAYRLLNKENDNDHEFHSSLKKLLLWNMARGGGDDDDDDFINLSKKNKNQTTTTKNSNLRDLSIELFAAIMETCPGKWLLDPTDDDDGSNDGKHPPPPSSLHDNATVTGKGRTLCALTSLSLGELRLGLGRVVVTNDDNNTNDDDDDDDMSFIAIKNMTNNISRRLRHSLAITKCLVHLLATLADDDDDENDNEWWELNGDDLLYLKRCLDDAHDVIFQFLSCDIHPLFVTDEATMRVRDVALSCVEGMGAWLAETELECVPSPSACVIGRAMRNGVHLCHVVASVGGDGGGDEEKYSLAAEPIVYLLPSLVRIATSSSSSSSLDELSGIMTGSTTTNNDHQPHPYPGITTILTSFLSRIVNHIQTSTNPTFLSTIGWPYAFLTAVYRRDDDGIVIMTRELVFQCLTVLVDCLQPLITTSSVVLVLRSPDIMGMVVSLRYALYYYYLTCRRRQRHDKNNDDDWLLFVHDDDSETMTTATSSTSVIKPLPAPLSQSISILFSKLGVTCRGLCDDDDDNDETTTTTSLLMLAASLVRVARNRKRFDFIMSSATNLEEESLRRLWKRIKKLGYVRL